MYLDQPTETSNNPRPVNEETSIMTSSIWPEKQSSDKLPNLTPFHPYEIIHWANIPKYYPSKGPSMTQSTGPNICITFTPSAKP